MLSVRVSVLGPKKMSHRSMLVDNDIGLIAGRYRICDRPLPNCRSLEVQCMYNTDRAGV